MTPSLAYRRARESDLRFVTESWLASFRTAHTAGLIAMDDWRSVMEPQIAKLLERPGVEVFVAHHPTESASSRADLYGWLCVERDHEQPLVHYVYVKHAMRRMGLARGLVAAAGIDVKRPFFYTCRTAVVARLSLPAARWRPLIARFPAGQHGA